MARVVVMLLACLLLCVPTVNAQRLSADKLRAIKLSLAESKPDTNRALAYLEMAIYYTSYPIEKPTDLDSSLYYSALSSTLSRQLHFISGEGMSYSWASNAYRNKGDLALAKEMMLKARDLYEKHHLNYYLIGVYVMMGYNWAGTFTDRDYLDEALKLSRKLHNKDREQRTLFFMAELAEQSENYQSGLDHRLRALALSSETGIAYTADQYSKLGNAYSLTGKYEEAIKYGLLSIQMAEEKHDTTFLMANRYNNLANTYTAIRQPDEAIRYFKKGVAVARHYVTQLNYHSMVCNVSNVMLNQKKYPEALAYLQENIKDYPPHDLIDHIVISKAMMEIYQRMKNYPLAQWYCDELILHHNKRAKPLDRILIALAEYYIATGQYDKAEVYADSASHILNQSGKVRELITAYSIRFKLDSAKGNYLSAIRNYQLFKKLNDSVFNDRRIKQIHELELQYETQKKDQSIQLLTQQGQFHKVLNEKKDRDFKLKEQDFLLLSNEHQLQQALAWQKDQDLLLEKALIDQKEKDIQLLTNQSQLQEAQLKTANLTRNVTILGIILLAVVVLLLYNRYQIRQRANQKIKEKNTSLQRLIIEKEWLLKEVHHRVKNNLQTILSLLESQSRHLSSDALFAIQDSQNRVYAMSLIHQKLYQSADVATINMEIYLRELVHHLRDSFNVNKKIHFHLNIDAIELDVSQSVPIGLIVNEAITNSIKYAFAGMSNVRNEISIAMEQPDHNQVILVIVDNGTGLPYGVNEKSSGGLGLKLMKGLSEDIEGTFEIKSEKGTSICIRFMIQPPLEKRSETRLEAVSETSIVS